MIANLRSLLFLITLLACAVRPTNAAAQPRAGLDCQRHVPPTGYDHSVAMADAGTPNAAQVAMDRAVSQLVDKHCRGLGAACDALRGKVLRWQTGQGGGQFCAMAVIERLDLAAWRRGSASLGQLDAALDGACERLLASIGKGKRAPRVALDVIEDEGLPGGPRATWLASRMKEALGRASAGVVPLKKGWNGRGVPRGSDLVVRARTTTVRDAGGDRVEVHWTGTYRAKGGASATVTASASYPAAVGPRAPRASAWPSGSKKLMLKIESTKVGSLCRGERTNLRLWSSEDLRVRVFDLYASDRALLLFPLQKGQDDRVQAGQTLALGGDLGFEADPYPGEEFERFVVIAAPTRAGLGRLADLDHNCRLPPDLAKQLHSGQGIPRGALWNVEGFRLIDDAVECKDVPPPRTQGGQAMDMSQIPECAP
jgi:hypothetical protein